MLEHHKRDLTEMASNEPSVFIDIKRLIAVQQKKTQILEPLERYEKAEKNSKNNFVDVSQSFVV